VSIPHQILRRRVPRKGFHNLLCSPFRRRIRCHIEMHDLPAVVTEDNQDKQNIECSGRNCEKVHGGFVHMIFQEGPPGLRRRFLVWFALEYQAGNRSLGEIESKFDQLTMNPRCAPGRIGQGHFFDEFPDLRVDPGSSRNLGFEFPEQPEALSMPSYNGCRLYDNQRIFPTAPYSKQKHPEDTVSHAYFRPFHRLFHDSQLLTKSEVFDNEIRVHPEH